MRRHSRHRQISCASECLYPMQVVTGATGRSVGGLVIGVYGATFAAFAVFSPTRKRRTHGAKALEKYRFRPRYPDFLHGAPPTPACAAFIKESRMNFTSANKLNRKSGVRLGEH